MRFVAFLFLMLAVWAPIRTYAAGRHLLSSDVYNSTDLQTRKLLGDCNQCNSCKCDANCDCLPSGGCPSVSGYQLAAGQDHGGDDIHCDVGAVTAQSGANSCNSDAACVAFNTFYRDGQWVTCKKHVAAPIGSSDIGNMCFYTKSNSGGGGGCPSVSGYQLAAGQDHGGDDIHCDVGDISAQNTANSCSSDGACVAFNTFYRDGQWATCKKHVAAPIGPSDIANMCFYTRNNGGGPDTLWEGQQLTTRMYSGNREYYLNFEDFSGNLVVYHQDRDLKWAAGTKALGGAVWLQGDGNLVVYKDGTAVWASNTQLVGTAPRRLVMQNDGNLVLYDAKNIARWSSQGHERRPFNAGAYLSGASDSTGYSHDSGVQGNEFYGSSWMSTVDGGKLLSQLSIPGTHDTMTAGISFPHHTDFAVCQTMSLIDQLRSGIRVLDMRCMMEGGTFQLVHGDIKCNSDLGQVLDTVAAFLSEHPSETVLMRVKEEGSDYRFPAFRDNFYNLYFSKRPDLFWKGSSRMPILNEVRGKVVVLQDFRDYEYGLSYHAIDKQDNYNIPSIFQLYDKWDAVRGHLEKARAGDPATMYMNYLSANYGATPAFFASGKSDTRTNAGCLLVGCTSGHGGTCNNRPDFWQVSCIWWGPCLGACCFGQCYQSCSVCYKGTNQLVTDWSGWNNGAVRVGIIMADFPGARLIQKVISSNF